MLIVELFCLLRNFFLCSISEEDSEIEGGDDAEIEEGDEDEPEVGGRARRGLGGNLKSDGGWSLDHEISGSMDELHGKLLEILRGLQDEIGVTHHPYKRAKRASGAKIEL